MKGVLVAIGIAAVAVGAAMYLRDGRDTTASRVPNINVRASASGGFAPETVLQIRPQAASASKPAPVSKRTALAMEMSQAKSYKAIYDRLRNTAEGQTPEGLHYLAQLLAACANVTDRKAGPPRQAPTSPEEMRTRFLATVSEKDPNRAARIAAYENGATMGSRCGELRDVATTEKEIRDLREQAAAAGEPKARAQQIANDIWASTKPGGPPPGGLPVITDAQLEALQQIVRTGDPSAMATVASVLASTMGDLYIRAGPNEQPVDPRAFHDAWQLAACEFGATCGRDNRQVAYGCAYEGRCGVDNLRDYYFYYGNSPAQSQNVGEYANEIVNAIRTGDWSYFQFVRGPPPNPGSVFRFGGGPPG